MYKLTKKIFAIIRVFHRYRRAVLFMFWLISTSLSIFSLLKVPITIILSKINKSIVPLVAGSFSDINVIILVYSSSVIVKFKNTTLNILYTTRIWVIPEISNHTVDVEQLPYLKLLVWILFPKLKCKLN